MEDNFALAKLYNNSLTDCTRVHNQCNIKVLDKTEEFIQFITKSYTNSVYCLLPPLSFAANSMTDPLMKL